VQALAASSLKSSLDVSFAEVAVSEAELALYQAENAARANRALLSSALGEVRDSHFTLTDVSLPGPLSDDAETLVSEALGSRPELNAAKLNQSASERFAEAERRLRYPSVSAVGAVGAIPVHRQNLTNQYGAPASISRFPFSNGGLYAARREEGRIPRASIRKRSRSHRAADCVRRARRVDRRRQRLAASRHHDEVGQAATTLRLANARYEIGLSGILELTQAQLAQTSAQLAAASAKYDYLARLAALKYATGAFR
jgi:outer membrane protein